MPAPQRSRQSRPHRLRRASVSSGPVAGATRVLVNESLSGPLSFGHLVHSAGGCPAVWDREGRVLLADASSSFQFGSCFLSRCFLSLDAQFEQAEQDLVALRLQVLN